MEGHEDERLCGKWRVACGLYNYNLRDVFTWRLLKTLLMGQVCSLLICGTAVSCQYLADAKVETPMLQSFLNYAMLLLVYTSILCTRKGDRNILHILKTKWWKYLLMGVADVEANYTVVKAYQYTTLTSIQTRFRPVHLVSVGVCMLGVGAMWGPTSWQGATRAPEQTVKNLSRIEFLGMMGLFGTLISGVQLFMPVVVKMTSATAVNLSLLTADLFSLFCGLFLFHYSFSTLYIISFVVIMVGFVMFNAVPTYTALPGSGSNEEENPPRRRAPQIGCFLQDQKLRESKREETLRG
ncbi:Solute carrier family 35 member F2, partial [Dissostichus eleginoides]